MYRRSRSALFPLHARAIPTTAGTYAFAEEALDLRTSDSAGLLPSDATVGARIEEFSPLGRQQTSQRVTIAILLAAAVAALILGGLNLGVPNLWHDELVHVFVAESILETGKAQLPSGVPYHNGTTMNLLIAFAMQLFGNSEAAVRVPSLVFAMLNVFLIYAVVRPLLGRTTALVAACALALSPWTVAWSREARFYSLQQSLYLATVIACWHLIQKRDSRKIFAFGLAALSAYGLGILTSFHSGMFVGAPAVYILCLILYEKKIDVRRVGILASLVFAAGAAALAIYALMNSLDRETVFERGGLGGNLLDAERAQRSYYLHWLRTNLGTGFFVLALVGFLAMPFREGRRGVYAALAFWVPIIVLTFFVGYRRPRFMFFAFPFYVAAFSYAAVLLSRWTLKPKTTWMSRAAVVCLILFAARLGLSAAYLVGDSVDAATGSNDTLARLHPQWKTACAYIEEHRDGGVILTTTYLPVLYYLGHVDNWYPSRDLWWESDESGMEGLKDLEDLKQYVSENPRGYFIAQWWRFERNVPMAEEVAWVNEHMTRIEEASTNDVSVWAWGY